MAGPSDHALPCAVRGAFLSLTGLHNRRGFMTLSLQQLTAANRLNQNFFFTYIDLNGMKTINDRFGHQEGDRAIMDTAEVRRSSCLVGVLAGHAGIGVVLRGILDFAKDLLVAADVGFEGAQHALGMARRRDDTGAHPGARHTGLDEDEIKDEFGVGVVDEDQVGIDALGGPIVDVDLNLGL